MTTRPQPVALYGACVPPSWTNTVASHREEVRRTITEAAWSLATRHGPMSVTMSQVATEAGIGRATLYKYFPDVESILHAHHERHVLEHLARLSQLRDAAVGPKRRLEAVAAGYAMICHHRAGISNVDLVALVHQADRVSEAEKQLVALVEETLADAVAKGVVRADNPVEELALYLVHALGAAKNLRSKVAVQRLVTVTLGALDHRHPRPASD